jgi:hypothetical protein
MTNSASAKSPIALLLHNGTRPANDDHLADILDFFGIPWAALTIDEAKAGSVASLVSDHPSFSVLTSAPCLAEVLQAGNAETFPDWLRDSSSVFVYGFQKTDACRNLLRVITGDSEADIRSLDGAPATASVTDDFPEMCGPMSGVQMHLEPGAVGSVLTIRPDSSQFQSIAGASEGELFARLSCAGTSFFCDSSQTMTNIQQRTETYFDVKKSFAGAVPIVMYLKWAFREICGAAREISACLIIDDLPLKPRYGFFESRDLLQLLEKHTFAATFAFIPWNWRRTDHETVAIFKQHSEKLSICVHGCNHTGAEFAIRSADLLDRKLKTARDWMNSLFERTGLHHDNVMVFPYGIFSPEAGLALKENGFFAAVNTDVTPADLASNETTIADLWSVAILRYGGFPIFTRRYIDHGIENFAFDGLLGKPCFLVGHHDLFRDQGRELTEFLEKLNSLNWKLHWRTLESAVCRSYSIQCFGGITKVKMFAKQLFIENTGSEPRQVLVLKEEADIGAVRSVTVSREPVDYTCESGRLQFIVNVPPGSTAEIRCIYDEKAVSCAHPKALFYRLRVAGRRYLSEFSDNYFSRNAFLHRTAAAAKRLLD